MLGSTSATPAQHAVLRPNKGVDGISQNRPLAEITNTPRRAFNDLTNHIQSKKGEAVPLEGHLGFKPTDQSVKNLGLQRKSFLVPTTDSDCKDDDSIEHCFGHSEPAEWKGGIDVMDYLKSLHEPVNDEVEEEPLSHVPLVEIPHLPEGFFDDMPDDLLDELSEDEVNPSIYVEP